MTFFPADRKGYRIANATLRAIAESYGCDPDELDVIERDADEGRDCDTVLLEGEVIGSLC